MKYSSSENYEQQIVIDTQAGSPPNVAILPQPGLIADLASKGQLTPLGDEEVSDWEGCLSVPGLRGKVPRWSRIRYTGFDPYGDPIDRTVEGFAAAWDKIIDRTGETVPQSGGEQSIAVMKALQALG